MLTHLINLCRVRVSPLSNVESLEYELSSDLIVTLHHPLVLRSLQSGWGADIVC